VFAELSGDAESERTVAAIAKHIAENPNSTVDIRSMAIAQ
jgi:hypothetical protein